MTEDYFQNFNFGHVINVLNSFYIDLNKPLHKQYCYLSPDMLYLEYKNNFIIDVGWVPNDVYDKKDDGVFQLCVNHSTEWEPELIIIVSEINDLKPFLRFCINYVSDKISSSCKV